MARAEPLLDRQTLQQRAADARTFLNADPAGLLATARSRVHHERRATGVLESCIPWFFEAQGLTRGIESADGPVVHGYDASERLVLIWEPRSGGRGRHTVVDYQDSDQGSRLVRYVITSTGHPDQTGWADQTGRTDHPDRTDRVDRVAVTGPVRDSLSVDISVDRHDRWVAHLWTHHDKQVERLQIWDSGWAGPDTITPDYHGTRLHHLTRNDDVVWTDPQEPEEPVEAAAPSAFADAATAAARQILTPIRRRLQDESRRVLLLTVCFEAGNIDFLPPMIGVVYQEDAEYLRDTASTLPDGLDALINPTLQEDYDFPVGGEFPYLDGIDAGDLDLPWTQADLTENILTLVQALNTERTLAEPPFLAVNLEGEATQYLNHLSPEDRQTLTDAGLT